MINLLPYEDRKAMESEQRRRFLVIASFAVSAILILGILLLLPFYFSLILERRSLAAQALLFRESAPLVELQDLERTVKDFNQKLEVLKNSKSSKKPFSEILKKIVELQPEGVFIENFSFSRFSVESFGKITIEGSARRREDFLSFTEALKGSGFFKKVDSPLSNLLRQTNFEFLLELELGE